MICAGNSQVIGEFPSQRPDARGFDVSLICAWINGWVYNREAGDLRRCRANYDVTAMNWVIDRLSLRAICAYYFAALIIISICSIKQKTKGLVHFTLFCWQKYPIFSLVMHCIQCRTCANMVDEVCMGNVLLYTGVLFPSDPLILRGLFACTKVCHTLWIYIWPIRVLS